MIEKETEVQEMSEVERFVEEMLQVKIPAKYDLREYGVYVNMKDGGEKSKDKWVKITSAPIVPYAYVRDEWGSDWQTNLRFLDQDGVPREEAFPNSLFLESNNVLKALVNLGFGVKHGHEKDILGYLRSVRPTLRFRLVKTSGWHGDVGKDVFVLPNETIGDSTAEPYYLQDQSAYQSESSFFQAGTLADWQQDVAKKLQGNRLLVFSACVAFAGPLLKFLEAESGGFHLYGHSSRGKTTALQVAASVWGYGASPTNASSTPFMQTWSGTSNSLETIASNHNDTVLPVDELGMCPVREFEKVVYVLAGGKGKNRMDKNANLKKTRSWRVIILSSGETSVLERLELEGGKAKAGQLVRLMDICIDDKDIIENTHDIEPAEFVDSLKASCAKTFGTAGPAFVQDLISAIEADPAQAINALEETYKYYKKKLTPANLKPEHARAVGRLALVQMAGSLASQWDILPLTVDEIEAAVILVRDMWLKKAQQPSGVEKAVDRLEDYISRNKMRFQSIRHSNEFSNLSDCFFVPTDTDTKEKYLISKPMFFDICDDENPKDVCRELSNRGFLHVQNPGKNQSRFNIGTGHKEKRSFYAIYSKILKQQEVILPNELGGIKI